MLRSDQMDDYQTLQYETKFNLNFSDASTSYIFC